MPGHVAQMQKLFQSAKASLRLDVRFASSPVGSIDSRLPTSPEDGEDGGVIPNTPDEFDMPLSETQSKDWRYSRAPGFITELGLDVREPFPEGSPQLPAMLPPQISQNKTVMAEPLSSGFTSPIGEASFNSNMSNQPKKSSSPMQESSENRSIGQRKLSPGEGFSASDLERPLTELRVSDSHEMDVDSMNESPIVSHLKRKSVEVGGDYADSSSGSGGQIVLSPSAKAAADSAKLKRGLYSDLFPKPPTHKGSSEKSAASSESQQASKPCPDPLLHQAGPAVRCPDPTAHFASQISHNPAHHGIGTTADVHLPHHTGAGQFGHLPTRATATGSPMPLLKVKPPSSLMGERRHRPWYPPLESSFHSQHRQRHRQHLNAAHITSGSEHFQPGWYYAKDSPLSSPRQGPAMYSFSTAAAKVVGQDPAPDSMIRDSYRTDTLTPLAKPPSRYKKSGISAIASARGNAMNHPGPSYLSRPPQRRMHSTRSRLPDNLKFRSSPPQSSMDSFGTIQARKRTRDLVSPTTDILEDGTAENMPKDPQLKLEEGEEVIEIDEETRAAVRMSLFGPATPEMGSEVGGGLKEISPNVTLYRKGTGPSGSRKKRRPSYWDADLEEVVRSPAARHVVSSPIKKDDVRSLQADVEFQEDYRQKENRKPMPEDELEGISRIAEGPTVMYEDVCMDHQDLDSEGSFYSQG